MTTQTIPSPTSPDAPPVPPASDVAPRDEHFHSGQVFTIGLGHFIHDAFSAFIAPLLPLIRENLSTSLTGAGSLALFAQLPSILNPFIGYLADKISLRYFIILAPAITATLLSAMGLAPSYAILSLLLLVAGVSIAAFHAPAPAMIGRISGAQTGKGMSIFMAAGELGRTLGPILAVAGVGWYGLGGVWRLAIIGWITSIVLFYRLHDISAAPSTQVGALTSEFVARARRIFLTLGGLMLGRSLFIVALTIYLPLFITSDERSQRGLAQAFGWLTALAEVLPGALANLATQIAAGNAFVLGGVALALLEGAGVLGALAAGTGSDSLGRKRTLLVLLSVSPVLGLLYFVVPAWLIVPLLLALGFTAISPTPVLLALVQDHFVDNRALANGIFLALNFLVRALGIFVVGLLGDGVGLTTAFVVSAAVAFLSIPAVLALPRE